MSINNTSNNFYRETENNTGQKGATVEQANAYYADETYESYFIEYTGDVAESIRRTGLGDVFFFNKFFALLFVKKGMLRRLLESVPGIVNIEKSFIYTLSSFNIENNSPDLSVINKQNTTLNGEGVIVAIVGTGIDYLNPRFLNEKGETRIVSIWDQGLDQGPKPATFFFGTEFTRENINNAIKVKGVGKDPYEIVNHKDEVGHGTSMAGLIGGRNLGGRDIFTSVAPNCEFAIVKLKRAKRSNLELAGAGDYEGNAYDSNDITSSMRYLSELQQRLKRPMVVYLTIGTNSGGHDGGTVAERYLDFFTNRRDFSMVLSTGGEGNTATHTSGNLLEVGGSNIVEIAVAPEQENLFMSIYTVRRDRVSIGVENPQGKVLERIDIPFINGAETYAELGQTGIKLQYFLEVDGIGDQRIDVLFTNISEGIWKIRLIGENVVDGEYNCWLPQRELLRGDTRFVNPNSAITLMTPATANNAIVGSSYSQIEGTTLSESGNGFTRDGRIKPNITVPSKNILTMALNNNIVASGPAISGAVLAGAVALLYQWGIVRNNDINLFPQKIISYLVQGVERKEGVTYPNEREGFGVFNFQKFFISLGAGARIIADVNNQQEIFKNYYLNEDYENYIVDYTGNIFETFENIDYGVVYFSDNFAAIVSIKKGTLGRLLEDVPEITNIQKSYLFTMSDIEKSNESYSPLIFDRSGLDLEGQNVIVGIIGPGIDYLNERFMTKDGRTRIISIWDQTLEQGPPPLETFGTEFDREKINEAIRTSKEGRDPYSVVNHKDDKGEGTAIAGIAGARNLGGSDDMVSLAPRCEFAVVKLKEAKNNTLELNGVTERKEGIYETTDIGIALKHLSIIQLKEKKPMVVYVPLGSNCGGHDGSDALERYIEFLVRQRGFVVATTSGNQGNTNTHASGFLTSTGDVKTIEVNIGQGEKNFCMGIYMNLADRVSIGVVSPSGKTVERIPAPLGQEDIIVVNLEGATIEVRYLIQEQSQGDQAIILSIYGVTSGVWQIRLLGDSILGGRYDAWMHQRELLTGDTRFLRSDTNTTLMTPSTANNILVSSYFNEVAGSVPPESGRGYTRDGRIKPGIGIEGTNILTLGLNNQYVVASGNALTGGILIGMTAILLQWGIVDKNDINMFASRIRNYLVAGTVRQEGVSYPNREVGYGVLSISKMFQILKEISKRTRVEKDNSNSVLSQGIYISIPKEVYLRVKEKNNFIRN